MISRSVRDSAAMLDATAGTDPGAPYAAPLQARPFVDEVHTDPGRLRIAFTRQPLLGRNVHPDCISGLEATAKTLADKAFDYIPFTPLFNITGQPAMSVPLHWNAAGLPIGMQFVGRFGDEATLFRLAGQFEQAKPWLDLVPAGF